MPLLPSDPFAAVALLALLAAAVGLVASKRFPKALGFAVLTLAAYGLQVGSDLFAGGGYRRALGFTTPDTLAGDWWRPLSYLFVHADLFHAVGNLFVLATAGPLLEERVGARRWVALYLLGGALAAVSHALLYPDVRVAAVGASGAIMGIVGALAIVAPNARVPVPLMFFILWFPAWVAAALYAAFNFAYALGGATGVAWYGHFAGLAAGIFAGAALRRLPAPQARLARRLPTADQLAPLATDARTRGTLERLRAIGGETPDDAQYQEAWVARFLESATCPTCGTRGLALAGKDVRCRANGHPVTLAPAG